MPADEFIWKVGRATRGRALKSPAEVKFEGYRQVAPKGKRESAITYDVPVQPQDFTELQAIYNFFDAKDGMPFTWTPPVPPITTQRLWTCKPMEWTYGDDGGLVSEVTFQFELFNTP